MMLQGWRPIGAKKEGDAIGCSAPSAVTCSLVCDRCKYHPVYLPPEPRCCACGHPWYEHHDGSCHEPMPSTADRVLCGCTLTHTDHQSKPEPLMICPNKRCHIPCPDQTPHIEHYGCSQENHTCPKCIPYEPEAKIELEGLFGE